MQKNVLITGATGMIGSLVLQRCLTSPDIAGVTSLARRDAATQHDKLNQIVVDDFLALDREAPYFKAVDIVFYCLGVYSGAVARDKFRQITVDYPRVLADILLQTSPKLSFCLLSGQGADRTEKSRLMFARDKGAIENSLAAMGFKAFHSFRPGYIYPVTPREEPNFSYRLMRTAYPLFKMLGPNYSIKSTELADAMFHVGLNGAGQEVFENKAILDAIA